MNEHSAENDATTCKHCDRPLGGVSGEGSRYYVHTEGSQRGLRTCAITPYGFNAEPIGAECERICNGSRGIEPTTPIPPEGCYCLFRNGVIVRTDDGCPFHSKRPGVRVIPPGEKS